MAVIGILIEAAHARDHARGGGHLLVEHLVAQPLGALDVLAPLGEADFEIADAPVDFRRRLADERQALRAGLFVQLAQREQAARSGREEGIALPPAGDVHSHPPHLRLPFDGHFQSVRIPTELAVGVAQSITSWRQFCDGSTAQRVNPSPAAAF